MTGPTVSIGEKPLTIYDSIQQRITDLILLDKNTRMEDFQKKFILALLAYGVKRDVDIAQLCKASGIDYKQLNSNKSVPAPASNINMLWQESALRSGDHLFGLHFGESMQLAALGIIGQLVQTSATIGEALTNAGALTHLITDMFQIRIAHSKKTFTIHLIPDQEKKMAYPYTYRHMADYLMVFIIHEMDGLVLEKIEPSSVTFPYHIAEPYEYSRVFRCARIRKGADLSMEFPSRYLDMPILSANYALQKLLLEKMAALIQDTNESNTWHSKIYTYLLTNSYLSAFSQEMVAANFNMTTRNLQRKLKDEGITYLEIIESVRRTLAINYLSNSAYNIKDIAYMLGYNEASAFLRAFKRWTGKTPSIFKKDMKKEPI
jgi:AraC-like DNA-binding protein